MEVGKATSSRENATGRGERSQASPMTPASGVEPMAMSGKKATNPATKPNVKTRSFRRSFASTRLR